MSSMIDTIPTYDRRELLAAYRHHYKHGGYVVGRRMVGAYRAALHSLAMGACTKLEKDDPRWVRLSWDADDNADASFVDDWDAEAQKKWRFEEHNCEQFSIWTRHYEYIGGLGGVWDADRNYELTVEADCAVEACMVDRVTSSGELPETEYLDRGRVTLYSGQVRVTVVAKNEIDDDHGAAKRLFHVYVTDAWNNRWFATVWSSYVARNTLRDSTGRLMIATGFAPMPMRAYIDIARAGLAFIAHDNRDGDPTFDPYDLLVWGGTDGNPEYPWLTWRDGERATPRHLDGENIGLLVYDADTVSRMQAMPYMPPVDCAAGEPVTR